MYIAKLKNKIIVSCPYNKKFVDQAHKLKGKWLPVSKTWAFPFYQEKELLFTIESVYGKIPDRSIVGWGSMSKVEIVRCLQATIESSPRPLNFRMDKQSIRVYQIANELGKSNSIYFDLSDDRYLSITIEFVELSSAVVVEDLVTTFEKSEVNENYFVGMMIFEKVTPSFLRVLISIIDGSIYPHNPHTRLSPYEQGLLSEFLRWNKDKDSFMFRGIMNKRVRLKDQYNNELYDWTIDEVKQLLEFNGYHVKAVQMINHDNKETEVVVCEGFAVTANGVAFAFEQEITK
ncbi:MULTISPECIES: hypothetical protein [unclassified Enterococcus]|uniref:hypothetical protein n=1 Tax=unclassified Enterococcus TaxID=2608891 RepID=UPI001CE21F2F|nr:MULTISPECIES: hypothetical protein [unclassified Enterococcus]MCA5014589.1 hypothetical protein [Enterococcus sp. S23]MCA5017842.1 hypothetical protein [Enterococcus sp. S22(2020)]